VTWQQLVPAKKLGSLNGSRFAQVVEDYVEYLRCTPKSRTPIRSGTISLAA
jgi:hypothetical protein